MIANKGDIPYFTIVNTRCEGVVEFCDEEDLKIKYSSGIVSSFKRKDNNWMCGTELVTFTFLAPWSDEITGTKFHSEGGEQLTTQRLADIQILIQCDHSTFTALSLVNKLLHALSKDKFYENEIYKGRLEVHYPQYFTEVTPVQEKGLLSWKKIYKALQQINLKIPNLTKHYVSKLDWVTDKKLDLLRLYDAIQSPETRSYLKWKVSFENIETWRYFIEKYSISIIDTTVNINEIQSFLYRSPIDLLELFYNKNWEILVTHQKYNLYRVLAHRLSSDYPDGFENNTIEDFSETLLSKLTKGKRSRLIIRSQTYQYLRKQTQ